MNLRLFSKLKTKKTITIAVAALVVLWFSQITPAARSLMLEVLKHPLIALRLVTREINGAIFFHRNLVLKESLSRQVDYLTNKLNELKEVELENARLKDLLHLKENAPFKVVAAQVIGRSPENWSSVILVDKGSAQGVRVGMGVMNYLGLVGRVIETTRSISSVMLLNDPSFSVSSMVQRSREEGLICGGLEKMLTLKYLAQDADVLVGDNVVTSGYTDAYPQGIIVGTVMDIGEEFSSLSRYAIVKPAVDLSSVEEVLIIFK